MNFMQNFTNRNKVESMPLKFGRFNTLPFVLRWDILFYFCIGCENDSEIVLNWSKLFVCICYGRFGKSIDLTLLNFVIEDVECILVASAFNLSTFLINQFNFKETSIWIGNLFAFLSYTGFYHPIFTWLNVKRFDGDKFSLIRFRSFFLIWRFF